MSEVPLYQGIAKRGRKDDSIRPCRARRAGDPLVLQTLSFFEALVVRAILFHVYLLSAVAAL